METISGILFATAITVNHMAIDGFMQNQALMDFQCSAGFEFFFLADVTGTKNKSAIIAWKDVRIGKSIYRGVEDNAAVLVAIGRKIGAASGKTKPQRCAGADVENLVRRHEKSRLNSMNKGTERTSSGEL